MHVRLLWSGPANGPNIRPETWINASETVERCRVFTQSSSSSSSLCFDGLRRCQKLLLACVHPQPGGSVHGGHFTSSETFTPINDGWLPFCSLDGGTAQLKSFTNLSSLIGVSWPRETDSSNEENGTGIVNDTSLFLQKDFDSSDYDLWAGLLLTLSSVLGPNYPAEASKMME